MTTSARFRVFENSDSASARVAEEVALLIRERAILGRTVVLGLSAEKTSQYFFKELIYLHRAEGLSFQNVITFNMDEYLGLGSGHPASLRSFMQRGLFDHIDIPPGNIHFFSGDIGRLEINRHGKDYEAKIARAGGIDYQILGLRLNGCLGLHNPWIPNDGLTQRVEIYEPIREQLAKTFGGIENVPTHAISLGYHSILKSRRIVVLAWGSKRAQTVKRVIHGPITPVVSASYLQTHPGTRYFLDAPAASLLNGK